MARTVTFSSGDVAVEAGTEQGTLADAERPLIVIPDCASRRADGVTTLRNARFVTRLCYAAKAFFGITFR